MMKYKNYIGHAEYDGDAKLFHGEVLGLSTDVITFQGKTVTELETAFKESVDDYLAWCKKRGDTPQKSFSGKLNVSIPPHLHEKLSVAARAHGITLNAYINDVLSRIA